MKETRKTKQERHTSVAADHSIACQGRKKKRGDPREQKKQEKKEKTKKRATPAPLQYIPSPVNPAQGF
jgi:hypothetical protein